MKNRLPLRLLALALLALPGGAHAAQPAAAPAPAADTPSFYPGETPAQRDARLKWWREARFGLFIHWGLYAVPAGTWQGKQIPGIGEWIMNRGKIPVADYAKFTEQFNPVKYDADAWVRLAKEAGMKYIVITSKHHDGFALFKSAASPYNLVDATPFKRDALKELAAACQKHGIKLGFYYSQAQDWHHRGGAASGGHWDAAAQAGDMDAYIRDIAVPQVREILTNYGPIAVLWWDTPTNMTRERADLLAPLVKLQPGLVLNNRLGGGYLGDTETPENRIPATGYPRDWEACMTMNDTWGFKSYDHNWKSATMLIRNLVDIASKGGNYLLNVGPTAEGEIPAPSVERLKAVGAWMKKNGESIYATKASPFLRLGWGRATQKPDRLYLHVFNWPADGTLVVPMSSGAKKAYLLGEPGKPLKFAASATGLRLTVPAATPDAISSTIVLEGVGQVAALPPPPIAPDADGSVQLPCDAADLSGKHVRVEGNTNLNLGAWRGLDDTVSWQVKFDRPGAYDVMITAAVPAAEAGSSYALNVGAERLEAKTVSTAGKDYQAVKVGTIQVTQAGTTTVTLKPVKIAKTELMRLRTLTLKPAAK
jgi:alpha-L-fucosidase